MPFDSESDNGNYVLVPDSQETWDRELATSSWFPIGLVYKYYHFTSISFLRSFGFYIYQNSSSLIVVHTQIH